MEQWRSEFQFWRTEQEEYEEFAQTLCSEFQNWQTPEEDILEYGNQFLMLHFAELPLDVIKVIKTKVWKSLRHRRCSRPLPFGARGLPSQTRSMMKHGYSQICMTQCHCLMEDCTQC